MVPRCGGSEKGRGRRSRVKRSVKEQPANSQQTRTKKVCVSHACVSILVLKHTQRRNMNVALTHVHI